MRFSHVYVHVPFCARRCSYCDFAIAVRSRVPVASFVADVRRELSVRGLSDTPATIDTLYFGGGTPSRLGGQGIVELLEMLGAAFVRAPGAEITLEANPDDVTVDAARAWRAAGVNRVSLGAQSFDPAVLAWMHRTHDADAPGRAVEILRHEGIPDYSLDLIYALPPEIRRDWHADVDRALALAPSHLSAYGLTVEQGTPLARWQARGQSGGVDEERFEREFTDLHDWMAAAGYEHYEVSNYALPGRRAIHNSAYWRQVPYLGLGPSAHGFDGSVRRWNAREYADWSQRLSTGIDPEAGREELTDEERELERVYLGLRTLSGVEVVPGDPELVSRWEAAGWAWLRDGRVVLTSAGWLRLDALAAALTEHRSHY